MKMKLDDEPIVEIEKEGGYKSSSFGRQGQRGTATIEYIVDSEDDERCVLRIVSIEKSGRKSENSGDAMRDHFTEMGKY